MSIMDFEVTRTNIKHLAQLIANYEIDGVALSAEEYADKILSAELDDEITYNEDLVKHFLNYKKHEKIFQCIFEYLLSASYKFKEEYKDTILLLLYFFTFVLNETNFNRIKKYCLSINNMIIDLLMGFVTTEAFLVLITEITCRVFESEYTLSMVIKPLVQKVELLKLLQKNVTKYRLRVITIPKIPVTKPKSPRLTKPKKSKNDVVIESHVEPIFSFVSKEVPRSTYHPGKVEKQLRVSFEKNRENALKLLAQARKDAFSCAKEDQIQKKNRKTSDDLIRSDGIVKARKVPKIKPVKIKTNTTMLMREAAQMMKNCEEEMQKIDHLAMYAYNPNEVQQIEAEIRKTQQKELLQNIQKKHLLGLLTREEAILAKQNVIKANKEKMEVFKEERVELYKKLEEWREREHEKIQALIEKSQTIQKNAKEAEKKSIEDKQKLVKQMQEESRELWDQAMEKQREELNRKIELIKDLKELQSLKELNKKEFDPTETCNLGLLCEMSIAELQERLFLLKVEVRDEQEKKKNLINEAKRQRQEVLNQAKEFVEQNQTLKIKPKREKILVAEDTAEIIELRNRIAEVRRIRLTNNL